MISFQNFSETREKEMNKSAIWVRMIISCVYGGLAVISYLWDITVLLMLLGIPWSIPLMIFSGLILHMTVEGKTIMSVGSLIGVMLNIGLYLFILRRK